MKKHEVAQKMKVRHMEEEHGISGTRFKTSHYTGGKGTKTEKRHMGGDFHHEFLVKKGKMSLNSTGKNEGEHMMMGKNNTQRA